MLYGIQLQFLPTGKGGFIILIWKEKEDRHDYINYREITLLSEPGKEIAYLLLMWICIHFLKYQRPGKKELMLDRLTTERIIALRILVDRRREFRQGMIAAVI